MALEASFTGTSRPLDSRTLARTVLLHPLRAVMTFPRILRQAARLYLQKGLKVYTKPEPCSSLTIREAPPPLMERLGMKVVTGFLEKTRSRPDHHDPAQGRTAAFSADPAACRRWP